MIIFNFKDWHIYNKSIQDWSKLLGLKLSFSKIIIQCTGCKLFLCMTWLFFQESSKIHQIVIQKQSKESTKSDSKLIQKLFKSYSKVIQKSFKSHSYAIRSLNSNFDVIQVLQIRLERQNKKPRTVTKLVLETTVKWK